MYDNIITDFLGVTVGTIVFLVLYFIPALVAASKKHRNRNAILALNIIFGWTLIGWGAALIWSLIKRPHPCNPCPDTIIKEEQNEIM